MTLAITTVMTQLEKLDEIVQVEMVLKAIVAVIFVAVVAILLPIQYTYAGGVRGNADERYDHIPGAGDCWAAGYDDGALGKYDQVRADECNSIPGDQYNASWGYGCTDAGLTDKECNEIKKDD